jgi:ferredoxin
MPIVNFVKEKKQVEVPEGANLRREAMKAGVRIYNGLNGFGARINEVVNCHGLGHCGSCRVLVTKGQEHASQMSLMEKARLKFSLAYIGHEEEMRLSCQVKVMGDMDVETCPDFNLFGENFFS